MRLRKCTEPFQIGILLFNTGLGPDAEFQATLDDTQLYPSDLLYIRNWPHMEELEHRCIQHLVITVPKPSQTNPGTPCPANSTVAQTLNTMTSLVEKVTRKEPTKEEKKAAKNALVWSVCLATKQAGRNPLDPSDFSVRPATIDPHFEAAHLESKKGNGHRCCPIGSWLS